MANFSVFGQRDLSNPNVQAQAQRDLETAKRQAGINALKAGRGAPLAGYPTNRVPAGSPGTYAPEFDPAYYAAPQAPAPAPMPVRRVQTIPVAGTPAPAPAPAPAPSPIAQALAPTPARPRRLVVPITGPLKNRPEPAAPAQSGPASNGIGDFTGGRGVGGGVNTGAGPTKGNVGYGSIGGMGGRRNNGLG